MSATVPLSKPITAHGEEVHELTLRAPGTKDIIELGLPTLMVPSADGTSVGVEVRQKVVQRYVSRLAQIPMSSVEALMPGDWGRCTEAVLGFFGMNDGEAPTSTPSSD